MSKFEWGSSLQLVLFVRPGFEAMVLEKNADGRQEEQKGRPLLKK